ncbi:MAG: hypothetical protein Q4P32_06015 [Micrococcales bacterium]|nr:hypothetical protein [Micrococcales bacterium]
MTTSSSLRRSGALAVALCVIASGVLITPSASAVPGRIASAPAGTAAPPTYPVDPPTPACTGVTRSATLKLSASGEKETYWTHVTSDGSLHSDRWAPLRKPTNIGAPTVTVTTCRNTATGRWSLHSFTAANTLKDLSAKTVSGRRVDIDPRTPGYGWGVFTRGIKDSILTLEVARCVKNPATIADLGVAKGFGGLPLPGKRSYRVGSAIADTPLPAAPKGSASCGDMGRVTVPLLVNAAGMPAAAAVTREVSNAQWVSSPICPAGDRSCTENVREIVTVAARP